MQRNSVAIAIVAAIALTSATKADPLDDYVACLIGRAAVELNRQGTGQRNSAKALDVAYAQCREPAELANEEGDPGDFVQIMVEAMAERLGGA